VTCENCPAAPGEHPVVIYLVWTKRLFGVRGGKKAYEARLRTESFIEVEQAARA
jgi:hypothetical protein